jgi:hypothetical protein
MLSPHCGLVGRVPRIVAFDCLTLMRGSHHTVDVLWHDNRLFADMSPDVRAAWFHHVLYAIPGTGKQYLAALNTENYEAMLPQPFTGRSVRA